MAGWNFDLCTREAEQKRIQRLSLALRLFRRWVSLDLKGEYCQMARERIGKEAGMFEGVP